MNGATMNTYRVYQIVGLFALVLTGCGAQSASQVGISPTECTLEVGAQMSFAVDGHIADNAIVIWQADRGSVAFTGQGLNSVFTAPQTPGDVNISAIITSGTPVPQSIIRTCHVNDSDPQPAPTTGSSSPTSTDITFPTGTAGNADKTVVISEVMGNPCGGDEFRKWNDYIELYNYGDQPQDVSGLWLAVSGPDNKADMLVAWNTRNPNLSLNQAAVTNSTRIPAHGFALVLSPTYTKSLTAYRMPYRFPKSTIILTIAEGDRIGHSVYGIIGHGGGRDVVVLYTGGAKSILQVISTYGSPLFLGLYPQDIRDNRTDNVPLDLHTCSSAERVNALGADTFEDWREVSNGSPGEAPYP